MKHYLTEQSRLTNHTLKETLLKLGEFLQRRLIVSPLDLKIAWRLFIQGTLKRNYAPVN